MPRLLRSPNDLNAKDIRALYNNFNSPIAKLDCGKKCAPRNPNRVPFCCDICHAVPAAHHLIFEVCGIDRQQHNRSVSGISKIVQVPRHALACADFCGGQAKALITLVRVLRVQ